MTGAVEDAASQTVRVPAPLGDDVFLADDVELERPLLRDLGVVLGQSALSGVDPELASEKKEAGKIMQTKRISSAWH